MNEVSEDTMVEVNKLGGSPADGVEDNVILSSIDDILKTVEGGGGPSQVDKLAVEEVDDAGVQPVTH